MQHSWKGRINMSVKNRVTVNLEDDEYEALQQLAASTDRSLAWLGRRAICDFLQHKHDAGKPSSDTVAEAVSNERHTTQ